MSNTYLWMGFIEPYMKESFISNAFIKMGTPPSGIKIVRKIGSPNENTFGYIDFKTEQDALDAWKRCNNKTIPNSKPPAKFKLNHVIGPPEFTAYVGNLPKDVDDMQLFKVFADKFTSLRSAKITIQNGQSQGYGFLIFGNETDYFECMKTMNGVKINGRIIKVSSSHRDAQFVNPEILSDELFWKDYKELSQNYYSSIPPDLFYRHSINIPCFSRFYSKNELQLVDYSGAIDYNTLNSAQSQGLWDSLIVSGYRVLDPDYHDSSSFCSNY